MTAMRRDGGISEGLLRLLSAVGAAVICVVMTILLVLRGMLFD